MIRCNLLRCDATHRAILAVRCHVASCYVMLESVRCCAFSVSNDAAMQSVAKLLGLSDDLLRETMTTRTMTTAALPTELAAARSHAIVPHSTPNNHPLLTNGANEPARRAIPQSMCRTRHSIVSCTQ